MAIPIQTLIERARSAQKDIEEEIARRGAAMGYTVDRGRVVFSEELKRRHKAVREGLGHYLAHANPLRTLTAPVIYSLILPFALLDLMVTLYQLICFPVYGIARVPRRDYFVIDRHRLGYLNALQKLNCVYCGYANGVIGYVGEIAARTEQFWCPIKHARRVAGAHGRYAEFLDFGDEEEFVARWAERRRALRAERRD